MKCMHCGAEIADHHLVCPVCGHEIQIVPDYNPLDDVLTEQVKGAVSETLKININQEQLDRYNNSKNGERRRTDRAAYNNQGYGKRVGNGQSVSSQNLNNKSSKSRNKTTEQDLMREQREARRRRAEKKRELARKKKKRLLLIIAGVLIGIVAISVFGYKTSYTGRVNSGYKYLEKNEYTKAEEYFQKAIAKKKQRSEAYTGLSEVYLAQGEDDKAEQLFLDALEEQPTNKNLYEATFLFYIDTEQEEKIMPILDACESEEVVKALEEYESLKPEFSLKEEEIYDDVQALELTSDGKAIYYTTDGTDPTTSSQKYTDPIKLDEGETEIRAISVNQKGIPSLVAKRTFTVEFPIEDAPSVTPSTGQYEDYQEIKIVVPDGYTAYYTTDGSDPTTSSTRIMYSGPFDMPEGNTILSVVLMDSKERYSDVTKRNYELILSEE